MIRLTTSEPIQKRAYPTLITTGPRNTDATKRIAIGQKAVPTAR